MNRYGNRQLAWYTPGRTIALLGVILIMLLMSGCGKSIRRTYLRPDIDMSYITRIAVLPFENQSTDKYIAERVRNATITQILSFGIFDVVDKGLVDSTLREEAIEPGAAIDLNSLKRLGQRLNVQAFMLGSVDEVGTGRSGSYTYPTMSITLRLVEANAGMVLWQGNGHRSGDSWMGRLFGLAAKDPFQISDRVVKDLLKTLPRK